MSLQKLISVPRSTAAVFLVLLCAASTVRAQGPAPETAPPLFPGGGLISYNPTFTTRGSAPRLTGNVPATARPTFSHEGDINFTWGFYKNFDLTLILPIVTNHFSSPGEPQVGGTGLGDLLVLAKYRFYRRDSPRGTTQASVTLGPKLPTGSTGLTGVTAGFGFLRDCSPAPDRQTCFLPPTGPTPDSSTCGGWWRMKISILFSDQKAARQRGWAAIWNHVSGFPIVRTRQKTESENGLSARR